MKFIKCSERLPPYHEKVSFKTTWGLVFEGYLQKRCTALDARIGDEVIGNCGNLNFCPDYALESWAELPEGEE